MSQILDFIGSIMDAISALVNYLFNTVIDLIYLLRSMVSVKGSMQFMFSWLPTSCVAVLMIIMTLAILFRVMGRD